MKHEKKDETPAPRSIPVDLGLLMACGPEPKFDPQTGKALYRKADEQHFDFLLAELRCALDGVPLDLAYRVLGRLNEDIGRQARDRGEEKQR